MSLRVAVLAVLFVTGCAGTAAPAPAGTAAPAAAAIVGGWIGHSDESC